MDFLDIVETIEMEDVDVEHQIIVVSLSPNVHPIKMDLLSLKEYFASGTSLSEHVNSASLHLPDGALTSHVESATVHVNKIGWVNMTLENGWTQITGKRTAAYKILATGIVLFKGRISGANSTSFNFFTLPTGSRPGATVDVVTWGDGVPTLLNVNSSGVMSAAVDKTNLSLDGLVLAI